MNDDIVTRLKNAQHIGRNGTTKLNVTQLLLNRQAVDEIKRLRRDAAIWRFIARAEHAAWSQCKEKCTCLEMQFLDIRAGGGHE